MLEIFTCTFRYLSYLCRQINIDIMTPKDLLRICFVLEQVNRNHELIARAYTGLVMLEVNNLTSYDEAVDLRRSLLGETEGLSRTMDETEGKAVLT